MGIAAHFTEFTDHQLTSFPCSNTVRMIADHTLIGIAVFPVCIARATCGNSENSKENQLN